jgi:hypothetical protein
MASQDNPLYDLILGLIRITLAKLSPRDGIDQPLEQSM